MDGGAGGALADELGRRSGGRTPGVMRTAVQPVTVGASRSRAVERAHHVSILHIEDDHVGDVVESGELDATRRAVHGQALVSYRRTLIAGRLGEEVVKVVGHGSKRLPGAILRRNVRVDVDLEVVRHLPLNAVPFVHLLQLGGLVGAGRLIHLTILRQPVPERLPDQDTGQSFRQLLQLPLGRSVLWILTSRGGAQALPVIGRTRLRPCGPRVVDVLTGNVGSRRAERVTAVIVRGTAVEQVDRVGRIGVVRDVAIRPHEATSRGNHLESFRRHHKALWTRVGHHRGIVDPRLEKDINHLLANLVVWYDELVGADIRLLHHQVAPEVNAFGHVARVGHRAAIRGNANGVSETGASRAARKRDRAEEEPVRALLDVGGRHVGLRANRSSLHVKETAEARRTVVYDQLDVVTAIRTGVHGRLVLGARESRDRLGYLMLPAGHRLHQLAGGNLVVRRIGDGVGRSRDIRGRPVGRLRHIVRIGQEITSKPRLTPDRQVGPVTSTPDLPYIRVKQRIEAFGSLRRQTTGGDANQAAKLR